MSQFRIFQEKGFWNGEPAKISACIVLLQRTESHPMWWQNAFAGQERQAIEVMYRNETFLIDNAVGTGFYKATTGKGSPQCPHASLSPGSYEFLRYIHPNQVIRHVDEATIAREAEIVDAYQEAEDPEEYQKLKSLQSTMEAFLRMGPEEKAKHIRDNMMRPANPSKQFNHPGKRDGRGKR